jgi:hypothetical protein
MGIVNRRNAFFGWLAWQVAKRVLRRKARSAVPTVDPETRRPNKPAIAALLALAAGAFVFWRSWRGEDETEPSA